MSKGEMKETLEKQLQLLSKRSDECALPEELALLTEKMVILCDCLLKFD